MQTGISDPKSITNEKHNHTEGAKCELINAGNNQTHYFDFYVLSLGRETGQQRLKVEIFLLLLLFALVM